MLTEYSFVADLHCHTMASSHAYSTVTELASTAAKRGLAAIGCTDHGVGMPDSPHIWHFANIRAIPERIGGVRILRGVEANIMGYDGHLDMDDETLRSLEIVIASMHNNVMPSGSVEDCTAAWKAVAENPLVDILGHSGSPNFPYDYESVIPLAGRNGKAIEINESSFKIREGSDKNCHRIAALCKRYKVPVAVDSDAHFHEFVGCSAQVKDMLREIDFPPELIINSSIENMNRFFQHKNIRF